MPNHTYYDQNWTGVAPQATNPANPKYSEDLARGERIEPLRARIDKWYFETLKKFDGHDAFISMIVSLVLYEKHLREVHTLSEESFTEGHKVFTTMSEDFRVSPLDCFRFWQDWRNGLLHRAMPKVQYYSSYTMSGDYKRALDIVDGAVILNPWRFRDRVIEIVKKNRDMWKNDDCPLAKIAIEEENLKYR